MNTLFAAFLVISENYHFYLRRNFTPNYTHMATQMLLGVKKFQRQKINLILFLFVYTFKLETAKKEWKQPIGKLSINF